LQRVSDVAEEGVLPRAWLDSHRKRHAAGSFMDGNHALSLRFSLRSLVENPESLDRKGRKARKEDMISTE
jgi:hypothetical protein